MIHFLCTLPYPGMREIMNSVLSKHKDISFTCIICDNSNCIEAVSQNIGPDTDAIISRGNMAEILQEHFDIPIFKIPFSSYDILRALRSAHRVSHKFVFIGTAEMVSCAEILCDLLQYSSVVFETIYEPGDIYGVMKKHGMKGYKLFVGDQQVAVDAQKLSYNCITVVSGIESVEETVNWAIVTTKHLSAFKEKMDVCTTMFSTLRGALVVLDHSGSLIYPKPDVVSPLLLAHLRTRIQFIIRSGQTESVKKIEKSRYHVIGQNFLSGQKQYYVFRISELPKQQTAEYIKYLRNDSKEVCENDLFWGNSEKILDFLASVLRYGEMSQPLLFIGEDGTEIDELVKYLFQNSSMSGSLLIVVDCAVLRTNDITYLFQNYNSPFYKTSGIIYLKNINELPLDKLADMFSFFENTNIFNRCKIILNCYEQVFVEKISRTVDTDVFEKFITVKIPSLREHMEDIGTVSNLYINKMNIKYGKQMIGLTREAEDELSSFSWPQNITQLKRILRQAFLNSNSSYLSAMDVRSAIKESGSEATEMMGVFDLNMPLRNIEKQIINYVLKEENYNQSTTAKRLEISRTTLWRLLNE